MPNIRSAKKRLRQNQTQRKRNKARKSALRTLMKKTFTEKNPDLAEGLLKEVYSALDNAAHRRIFHPNKSARHKAQLAKAVGGAKKTITEEPIENS